MKKLLERLDELARAAALRTAFDSARSLHGLCYALGIFRSSLGRDPDVNPERAGPPLVDEAVFEDLEARLRARLKSASEDGSLVHDARLLEILYEWARIDGDAAVRAWTDGLLEDDEDIIRLADAATQISSSVALGDRVARETPVVHRPGLERIVNVDRMLERLDAIVRTEPTPDILETINRFRQGLSNPVPGS